MPSVKRFELGAPSLDSTVRQFFEISYAPVMLALVCAGLAMLCSMITCVNADRFDIFIGFDEPKPSTAGGFEGDK